VVRGLGECLESRFCSAGGVLQPQMVVFIGCDRDDWPIEMKKLMK